MVHRITFIAAMVISCPLKRQLTNFKLPESRRAWSPVAPDVYPFASPCMMNTKLNLQMEEGNSYDLWGDMVGHFHNHFQKKSITPIYEEHWNEPDLTE